jgi:hypothetical protein
MEKRMADLICPKCKARVVDQNGKWRFDASEIAKCRDLPGTKRWAEGGDITWCPTLAAEAFKRDWIWDGHTYRDQIMAEIEAVRSAKIKKD